MLIRKVVYAIITSLLIAGSTKAQSYSTVQMGNVVYTSSSIDADSTIKKKYAILCYRYIDKYYHGKHLPLVYLMVSSHKIDTIAYELAYDNLSGYPSNYKYYGVNMSFNQPGIRIKVYTNTAAAENLLKLLDYGITNLKEIKRQRKALLKQDDDTMNSLSLSQDKITSILKEPPSSKIKAILGN